MSVPATCKYCGSDKGFRQHGYCKVDASRASRAAELHRDGSVSVNWERAETEGFLSDFDFESDVVTCRNCDAEGAGIEDIAGPLITYEPGDRVVCPDGFRAIVATVDVVARTLTVEGWHETFKFADVELMKVFAHG